MRIEEFVDPVIGKTWGELEAQIRLSEKKVEVGLGYPTDGFAEDLKEELAKAKEDQQFAGNDSDVDSNAAARSQSRGRKPRSSNFLQKKRTTPRRAVALQQS